MIKVKPKTANSKVLKPDGVLLDENGEFVEKTAFWIRRIKDGDVVEVEKNSKKKGA